MFGGCNAALASGRFPPSTLVLPRLRAETEYLQGVTASYAKLSNLEAGEIGSWTRENVVRVIIQLTARLSVHVLTLVDGLPRPRLEDFKNQRG